MKHVPSDVLCPLCGWRGTSYAPVEVRPGIFTARACPDCRALCRERLLAFVLLDLLTRRQPHKRKVRVVEVGGNRRFRVWARRVAAYTNMDVVEGTSDDQLIINGNLPAPNGHFEIAVLSYVLSVIRTRAERIGLLRELHRITTRQTTLIVFDDTELTFRRHRRLGKSFYHLWRFGAPLKREFTTAGWMPYQMETYPGVEMVAAQHEMPFYLCRKKR